MFLSNNAFCLELCLLHVFVDLNDFVIYATGGTLYTKSLASEDGGDHNELTIPVSRTGDDAVSSVTFDYNNSCIYWIDTTINAIQVEIHETFLACYSITARYCYRPQGEGSVFRGVCLSTRVEGVFIGGGGAGSG